MAGRKNLRNLKHPLYAWNNISCQAQRNDMRTMIKDVELYLIAIDNHSS